MEDYKCEVCGHWTACANCSNCSHCSEAELQRLRRVEQAAREMLIDIRNVTYNNSDNAASSWIKDLAMQELLKRADNLKAALEDK